MIDEELRELYREGAKGLAVVLGTTLLFAALLSVTLILVLFWLALPWSLWALAVFGGVAYLVWRVIR